LVLLFSLILIALSLLLEAAKTTNALVDIAAVCLFPRSTDFVINRPAPFGDCNSVTESG